MKTRIILLLAFFSVLAQAQRVPRSVFNASEYDKAKAEALAEGKDLALIVTSLNSTCPHAVSGTESVFKKMKSDYVLVLQDLSKGSETGALSKAIKQKTYKIYNSKGNVEPIVTVLSPNTEEVLSGACYRQISADSRKWIRVLDEEVAQAKAGGSPAEETDAAENEDAIAISEDEASEESGGMQEWTDVRGRSMNAELLDANDLTATFKLETGKVIDLPLTKLSAESRKTIEEGL